jgi:methylmalonyl-CoA/ethylmalonyl-CoA epimerase
MVFRGVHHIGVAVADLEAAVDTYTKLLAGTVEHRGAVEDQHVAAVSVLVGGSRIELLAPTRDDSPVGKFLAKRGEGMHHVAYEVDDVAGTLAELMAVGAQLIDESPRRGLFGLQVAFIHPDAVHGVLTEVVSVG